MTVIRDLVEYAFSYAGRLDDRPDRRLGAIHLLKLVYLADLAYARTHEGNTYSGIAWIFHKFGPYSADALAEIEQEIDSLPLQRHGWVDPIRSREFVRYSLSESVDEELMFEESGTRIPVECTSAIQNALRKNGSATSPLLHEVYSTEPMLNAAPGEIRARSPRLLDRPVNRFDVQAKSPFSCAAAPSSRVID